MKKTFKEVKNLLQEANNLIEAMLEVVAPDFMRVTAIVKELGSKPVDSSLERAYSAVVQELQYYDTLSQKMAHVIAIHNLILQHSASDAEERSSVSGVSLIRLNHIQFQVSCFEYLSSVNEIETNLGLLADYYNWPVSHYHFQHSNLLLSASRFINKNFGALENCVGEDTLADLLGKIDLVNSIYSMESERTVLQAYLKKPLLSDCEIEPLKKSSSQSPEIELF